MIIYIPIHISQELPDKDGSYDVVFKGGASSEFRNVRTVRYSNELCFHNEALMPYRHITHWLKPVELPDGDIITSLMQVIESQKQTNDTLIKLLAKKEY